jgi:hypothetical protein
MDEMDLLEGYIEARERRDAAQAAYKAREEALLQWMEANRRKSVKIDDGREVFTATYTRQHRSDIDEKGLKKALTAPIYYKYTKRVLDKKLLDGAVADGSVSPMTVARFVTEKPSAPFIKFTINKSKPPVVEDDDVNRDE